MESARAQSAGGGSRHPGGTCRPCRGETDMTDEQMQKYIDHAIETSLVPMLEAQSKEMLAQLRRNAEDVAKQWEKYPTREERLAEAEARAWDTYVAGALADP